MSSAAVRRTILAVARVRPAVAAARPAIMARLYQSQSGSGVSQSNAPTSTTTTATAAIPEFHKFIDGGLNDDPSPNSNGNVSTTEDGGGQMASRTDWSRSFHGLSSEPFPKEAKEVLESPVNPEDVEIKPDGIIYLPEIKYRRILNKAFGPGGWGMAPRGESIITEKLVTREYALVCHGRLVSIARGEQQYFDPNGIPTAVEGCKSNALMRCCKDLGIASDLWDPRFIRKFKKDYCEEKFAEHVMTKRKKKLWRRKGDVFEYPYKLLTSTGFS